MRNNDNNCKFQFTSTQYGTPIQSCDMLKFEYEVINTREIHNYDKNNWISLQNDIKQILHMPKEDSFIIWCSHLLNLPEFQIDIQANDDMFIRDKGNRFIPKSEIFNSTSYTNILNKVYNTLMDNKIFARYISDKIDYDKLGIDTSNIGYAHKLYLSNNSKICVFGDFHSSIHSLMRNLLRLRIMGIIENGWKLKKDYYIFFLGDLIDRGLYGTEIIYIVFALIIQNPKHVFLIRGNHEEILISKRGGFYNEIEYKFGDTELFYTTHKVLDIFPSCIFLKIDNIDGFIQLSHGGFHRKMESIKSFLESNNDYYLPSQNSKFGIDFRWSDYKCGNAHINKINEYKKNNIWGEPNFVRDPKNGKIGRIYHADTALEYMKQTNIIALLRGHQDMYFNSKIILYDDYDKTLCEGSKYDPVDWKRFYEKNITKYKKILDTWEKTKPYKNHSIEFPIHDKLNITPILPIYTFTTAVSPRIIPSDGFGIVEFNNFIIGCHSGMKIPYHKYW